MKENRIIEILGTEEEVVTKLCSLIEAQSKISISQRGNFKIGLSGGSLVGMLSKGLQKVNAAWDKWVLFFCDERVVPTEDPDSTFGCYKKHLIGTIPIKEEQFVTINHHLSAEAAALSYETKLKSWFEDMEYPRFDMLLLGMGPDGHTCSLFPNHPILYSSSWVAPITDSPKPPPSRITLTFPVINSASYCIFPITGAGKASTIKSILKEDEDLPANRVSPKDGTVCWILDKEAAALL